MIFSGRRLIVRGLSLVLCTAFLAAHASFLISAEVNWYTHNGGEEEGNFSALEQIDVGNVSRLGLAWSLDLPGEVSLEATPLAIDGTLYFTGSASDVYAVDARSGRVLWKYDPQIWRYRPESLKLLWGINRGVAYAHGRVFVGTHDGRLIALDAATGRVLWVRQTVPEHSLQTISGAPWVVKDKVLIGNGGADFAARGYVSAYEQSSGRLAWRFYTVPGDPAKGYEADAAEHQAMQLAARTWSGKWWKVGGGGGTVWDNMTYDPELGQLYIGVGNAGPYNPRIRSPGGGDNLFIASIVALDADTGAYRWHYQMNPSEAWDYKSTTNMVSAELLIGGVKRKVLMQAPTNGFFYVLDRTNGRLISAEKIGKVTWADHIDLETGRPVENPNIRYEHGPVEVWPSALGAHSWQGMSFNPSTRVVYVPTMQLGERIGDDRFPWPSSSQPPFHFGGTYIQLLLKDKQDGTGALLAWDPVAQKARWKVPLASFWNGGVLSTAGGLVFQGTGDGELVAYDARTGQRRWAFNAGLGIISTPITYTVAGRQYISILVGWGGTIAPLSQITNRGWKFGAQPRRLLTFALDAQAALPPTAPRDTRVHALDDPSLEIDRGQARAGLMLYQNNCAYCHGRWLISAGTPAPDLRESQLALNWPAFRTVVKEGTLLPKLMPKFAELSDSELREIFLYIRQGARDAIREPSAPSTIGYRVH